LPMPPAPSAAGRLAVVTVAHHSGAVLPGLARDLGGQTPPPALWVVVDNSPRSAPLRREDLLAAAPEAAPLNIRLLAGEEGDGFAAGCNRALEALAADGWTGWIWLLNPDTGLPRGDEIAALEGRLAALPARALVGTAAVDDQGNLEPSGGWIDAGLDFRRRRVTPERAPEEEPLALDWLSGCSLALQPTAHTPPARFDPRFPLYYEDMDLCLRLGRAGAPVLWLPTPVVRHRRGTGSGDAGLRRLQLSTLGYLRFLRRHCPTWVVALRSLRMLVLTLVRLPRHPRRSLAVLGALGRGLTERSR
ncbi:MAG: glycosyltransferase family 2 protein, partial [Synechococcaceae cyanobacterium]|nr:glycosyltransferase family 2 protein [Synechococcaceae cyanobacterium]